MNIKSKLSLQFSFIVATIIVFFSLLVYYFSYSSQLKKFRENLLDRASNTAILLINVAEVDSTLLKKIHQSTISLYKEEIAVTDSSYNVLYSNNIRYLSGKMIRTHPGDKEPRYFSLIEKDAICFRHCFRDQVYYVYVLAFDKSRFENLKELRSILFWSIIFSLWLSVLLSYLFSQRAIKPVSGIIKSIREINVGNLNNRLDEGNGRDEIAQLAIKFNELLSNLEIAFRNQEDFVSNASHELRTPLSVMIGESDYLLSHESTKEDYIKHISDMVTDLKNLNTLVNSLLELAQTNKSQLGMFSRVRVDEIIFSCILQIKNKYPGRKIVSKIRYPENPGDLTTLGDERILTIAFRNLIDNACKFSTEIVEVEVSVSEEFLSVKVTDLGIGIPVDELEKIYIPFKRASNVRFIGGFGLGLSLVKKILELHNAKWSIVSNINHGTCFEVRFRRNEG